MKPSLPIIITGTQYSERLSDAQSRDDRDSNNLSQEYAFGYKSLEITINGNTQPLTRDEDKFIAYGESFAIARQEFWARWSQYVSKRFKRNFVTILDNQ